MFSNQAFKVLQVHQMNRLHTHLIRLDYNTLEKVKLKIMNIREFLL